MCARSLGHGPREKPTAPGQPALNVYWDTWYTKWLDVLEREVRDKNEASLFDEWLRQNHARRYNASYARQEQCVRLLYRIYPDGRTELFPAWQYPAPAQRNLWSFYLLYAHANMSRALQQVPPFPRLPTTGRGTNAKVLEMELTLGLNRAMGGQVYQGQSVDPEMQAQTRCPGDSGSPKPRSLVY